MKSIKELRNELNESKQEDLIEAKLSPDQRKRLDGLIGDVIDVTDPFYLGLGIPGNNVDLEKTLETIESEFGKEVRDSVENGIDIWHYGRENRADGDDPLDNIFHRRGKGRITKKGKLNKQDAESLKKSIKKNLKSSSLGIQKLKKAVKQNKSRFAESKQEDLIEAKKFSLTKYRVLIDKYIKTLRKLQQDANKLNTFVDQNYDGEFPDLVNLDGLIWDATEIDNIIYNLEQDYPRIVKGLKRDKIIESKHEDIADLKALLKNPDPKVAKNYGGIEGYKKMIQSKIDKLMKEETELNEEQWVVYNKDTKKTKLLKTWKGAKNYADKNGGKVYDGAYFQDHKDEILKEETELEEAKDLEFEKGQVLKLKSAVGGDPYSVKIRKVDDTHIEFVKIDSKGNPVGTRKKLKKSFFPSLVTELEEAKYEIKNGVVHITKAEYKKVHRDFKGKLPDGSHSMMVNNPKTGGTTLATVKFVTEETEELEESKSKNESTEELDEALTRAQRIKRSQIAKRNKAKIQRALKKGKKKKASTETLQKRAKKKARDLLYTKLLKGRNRADVSAGEQERIEKKLDKMQGGINRIAKKLLPQLKKAEQEKLKKKSEE